MITTSAQIEIIEKLDHLAEIIIKTLDNEANIEETALLQRWLEGNPENETWLTEFNEEGRMYDELKVMNNIDTRKSLKKAQAIIRRARIIKIGMKIGVRAAIIAGLVFVAIWVFNKRDNTDTTVAKKAKTGLPTQVPPGTNVAILTLADGAHIILDSLHHGIISNEAGTRTVNSKGIIEYTVTSSDKKANSSYNTISTPKSRQYQVTLPDGSKVWLNSESSIRFPLAYQSSERWAEVTGEVYIEVHADQLHPFNIIAKKTTVKALGTRFNVKAYEDEKVTTATLLEGTIRVTSPKAKTTLNQAGQVAIINDKDAIEIRTVSNVDNTVAWKSGNFQFIEMHLPEIMNEIKRWYDVDVQYLRDTPSVYITGSSFSRSNPLHTAIQIISSLDSNLKITQRDNILIVSSK